MNKILSLLALLSLLLTFVVGCGGGEETEGTSDTEMSSDEGATEEGGEEMAEGEGEEAAEEGGEEMAEGEGEEAAEEGGDADIPVMGVDENGNEYVKYYVRQSMGFQQTTTVTAYQNLINM